MTDIIQTFVRRPTTAGEVAADCVRALAVVSVIAAGIGWGAVQVGIFLLALLGVLVPRALGLRPSVDITSGIIVLVAAWSNVFDLYTEVFGWDKLVHVALTGVIATLAVIAAQRSGILPTTGHRAGLVVATVAFGLAAGSVWEMLEWVGNALTDAVIYVGYDDTIGDLAADAVGGLIAGLALPFLTGRSAAITSGDRGSGDPEASAEVRMTSGGRR
ncbi:MULTISPECIES: hypothetical protein [unclassified Leifsonia]|uniref:hypothetical protein n=1 Tax=unclassified Leifsonia TaxID=2663824 RepID=UPI0006F2CC2D|nr:MULTISPECIES: hypothetical protein [unclassified Leifsonia]KQX07631.1 hypothetical protein ASC59_07795 [Leifsonia sp. Root1293]KRA11913.1 hypothetical protein ASD61_07795 [Leifsonia sp. Root60]